jgi:hypothetical protein
MNGDSADVVDIALKCHAQNMNAGALQRLAAIVERGLDLGYTNCGICPYISRQLDEAGLNAGNNGMKPNGLLAVHSGVIPPTTFGMLWV